jgi:hypothetical protein
MMKSKVLGRPMFNKGGMAQVIPDDMVENVGIMQGFMDDDYEDDDSDEGYEAEAMDERSPSSPEILMNNLRGDMRSMDARVDELATLVGEEAAMGTPTEVLALLQPVLAAQGGIGGLPAGGMPPPGMPPGMPPEMGMPPPEMGMPPGMPPEMGMPPLPPGAAGGIGELMAPPAPQAPPPTAQAPINMAKGGYVQVQRFQEGSGEEGVTPATTYPPELVKYAQQQLMAQRGAGNLKQSVEEVLPVYREILGGGDRRTMQGQALMDIAQAGLRLASGRNAQGANIAGGSFASQLASAAQGLPGKLAERAGQFQQEERAIKLAALKSAESNVEGQRKLFSQIVKSAGQSPFGKGDWDWAVLNRPGLLQKWTEGKASPEEDMLIQSAITKMQAPRTEFKTDPVTKQVYQVQVPGVLPPFVAAAVNARGGRGAPAGTTMAPTGQPEVELTPEQLANRPAVEEPEVPIDRTIGQVPAGAAVAPAPTSALPGPLPAAGQAGAVPERGGIWAMSTFIAGPVAGIGAGISKIPGLGAPFPNITQAQTAAKIEVENLIEAFLKSGKAPISEQDRLRKLYDIGPKLFDDPAALRDRLISIDEEISKEIEQSARQAYSTELSPATRAKARDFLSEAEKFKKALGVPVRLYNEEDVKQLPPNTEYLWLGKTRARTDPAPQGSSGSKR